MLELVWRAERNHRRGWEYRLGVTLAELGTWLIAKRLEKAEALKLRHVALREAVGIKYRHDSSAQMRSCTDSSTLGVERRSRDMPKTRTQRVKRHRTEKPHVVRQRQK